MDSHSTIGWQTLVGCRLILPYYLLLVQRNSVTIESNLSILRWLLLKSRRRDCIAATFAYKGEHAGLTSSLIG